MVWKKVRIEIIAIAPSPLGVSDLFPNLSGGGPLWGGYLNLSNQPLQLLER